MLPCIIWVCALKHMFDLPVWQIDVCTYSNDIATLTCQPCCTCNFRIYTFWYITNSNILYASSVHTHMISRQEHVYINRNTSVLPLVTPSPPPPPPLSLSRHTQHERLTAKNSRDRPSIFWNLLRILSGSGSYDCCLISYLVLIFWACSTSSHKSWDRLFLNT